MGAIWEQLLYRFSQPNKVSDILGARGRRCVGEDIPLAPPQKFYPQ